MIEAEKQQLEKLKSTTTNEELKQGIDKKLQYINKQKTVKK